MADVKWIKLYVDLFDGDKADVIEMMPERDAIYCIWIRLLTLAGKSNRGGFVMVTDTIPYTDEILAHKFKRPLQVVRLALDVFQNLDMIDREGGCIFINNWEEYQNLEKMESIKEYERQRKQEYRAKKKMELLPIKNEMSGTMSGTNPGNVSGPSQACPDIDKDLDREYLKKIENLKNSFSLKNGRPGQKIYENNIWLSEAQYRELEDLMGLEILMLSMQLWACHKESHKIGPADDFTCLKGWPYRDAQTWAEKNLKRRGSPAAKPQKTEGPIYHQGAQEQEKIERGCPLDWPEEQARKWLEELHPILQNSYFAVELRKRFNIEKV